MAAKKAVKRRGLKRGPRKGAKIRRPAQRPPPVLAPGLKRSIDAARYHATGVSIKGVAERFDLTQPGARKAIDRGQALCAYISEIPGPNLAEIRSAHHGRLRGMLDALQDKIQKADVPAINAAVNVLRRIAETFGTDAPSRTANLNVDLGRAPSEAMIREAATMIAARKEITHDDNGRS